MTMVIDNPAHMVETGTEDDPISSTPAPAQGARLRATEVLAWLAAQDDEAIVGYSATAHRCPLACYLHEKNGGLNDTVNDHIYTSVGLHGVMTSHPTPAWAKAFVQFIDMALPDWRPITASEARETLLRVRCEIAKDQAQFGWTEQEDEETDA